MQSDLELIDAKLLLPTSEELPCSDQTPVDNENQNTIPNWLLAILEAIWSERQDWLFGVDMGAYDREVQKNCYPAIIPNGFLSVGSRAPQTGRQRPSKLCYFRRKRHYPDSGISVRL